MIETYTVRCAYLWTIRDSSEILQYKARQWDTGVDEDGALKAACTHPKLPAIDIEEEGSK
jgi:hypothetical protein